MYRSIVMLAIAAAALWSAPPLAQSRTQLGPLCTSSDTPADKQIDACNNPSRAKCSPARSKQVPWSNSSLLGEVYLAAK